VLSSLLKRGAKPGAKPSAKPSARGARGANSPWRCLRHTGMRWWSAANLVSNVGTWMQLTAQNLLVLHLTHSAAVVGLSMAAQAAAGVLFGPLSGALVDAWPRQRVAALSQASLALVAFATAALLGAHLLGVGTLLGLAAVTGLIATLDGPACALFGNDLVPEEDVPSAIALGSVVSSAGRLAGVALAGAVVAASGPAAAYVANGVSFVCVAAVIPFLRPVRGYGAGAARGESASAEPHAYGPVAALGGARPVPTPNEPALVPAPTPAKSAAQRPNASAATLAKSAPPQSNASAATLAAPQPSPTLNDPAAALARPAPAPEPAPAPAPVPAPLPAPAPAEAPTADSGGGPRLGLRYFRRSPELMRLAWITALSSVFGRNYTLTLAVLVTGPLHRGSGAFGTVSTALAVGGVAGAVLAGRLRRPSVRIVGVLAGVGAALQIAAGLAPSVLMLTVLVVPMAIAESVSDTAGNSVLLTHPPAALRGRVLGVWRSAGTAWTLAGPPLLGFLLQSTGPRAALVLGGTLIVAAVAPTTGALSSPRRRAPRRLRPAAALVPELSAAA
jgi:MFS family permease